MKTNNLHITLPRRHFFRDDSQNNFIQKAIIASAILHLSLFLINVPYEVPKAPNKQRLSSIKMNLITPPTSYRLKKPEKFAVSSQGNSKDVAANKNQAMQKQLSKAGSSKKGPLSSPNASGVETGDSLKKGFEFKGKGLNALVGSNSSLTIAHGTGGLGSRSQTGGLGKANKGNNLSGDYRSPTGRGNGSGFELGKDIAGNYDRSIATGSLANKKGIDTAFVQNNTIILGSIDPEVLRKILGEYLSQFKFCYQQELQENSEKIRGIVDLNFRIDSEGRVSRVNIKSASTKFSDKGIGCMTGILRSIEFPKPKGGGLVDVRQPLNFYSENTKI